LPKVKAYTRKDRGKIISVPSYTRAKRPVGKKKVIKGEVNYIATHRPTRQGKVVKIKPTRIRYKPTRYKETGIFTQPKKRR
jgi:hypothetical protein